MVISITTAAQKSLVTCTTGIEEVSRMSSSTILVRKAPNRLELAELLMSALATVDGITEDLRVLVTRDNSLHAATSTY